MTIEETHRDVILVGGILSLIVIPAAISSRRRAFLKRSDLRYDNVAILWENVFILKAALDAFLGVLLLISLAVPPGGLVCKGLGILYQFEECMTLVLIMRMAQHPFYFMLKREDMNETRQYFNHTLLFCAGAGVLACAVVAAFSSFGPSYSLCWLTSVPMQFYAFFIPVMICLAFTITILVRLARVAHHRYASRLPTVYHGDFFRRIARGLELHFSFLAFVGVYPYAFRIASRAYIWRHGRQQPILAFLEYFTIAFRGPLDALAYMPKDAIVGLYRALKRRWGQQQQQQQARHQQHEAERLEAGVKGIGEEEKERDVVRLTLLGKARPLPDGFFTDLPTRKIAEKRIFVSTYNMAECSLESLGPGALGSWVPLGCDVYVVGVQECMAYQGLGEALLAHVNGGGEEYVVYSKAIGSTQKALGYHGLIAIWVLAKAKEVRANCFMLHESKKAAVARGKNLGVTVAENKGGVALAFRYYDTTFAFLNTHLASDLKGRSRLHKRTQDACQLLLETSLWREEYVLDLAAQHHVCVFMGDLNFRLKRPTPGAVLEDVAAICQRERDGPCGGRTDWRQLRYMELLRAAAGEADKGRYSLEPAAEGEEAEEAAGSSKPEAAAAEEEDEEAGEDGDGDFGDDSPEQQLKRGRRRRRHRPQRLPALVGGLVREMKSYVVATSPHSRAQLALRRSLSSYERRARAGEGNGSGIGSGVGGDGDGGAAASSGVVELSAVGAADSSTLSSAPPKVLRLAGLPLMTSTTAASGDAPRPRDEPLLSTWEELLEADELSRVMRSGEAFYGFREPAIRFPPSYRRVKGPAGQCLDYTDAERLKRAYSIQVKEKGLSFAGRRLSSTVAPAGGLGSSGKSLGSGSSQLPPPQQAPISSSAASMAPSPPPPPPPGVGHSAATTTNNNHSSTTSSSRSGGSRSGVAGGGGGDAGAAARAAAKTTNRVPSYTDRILVHTFPDYASRVQVGPYELCDALTASDHRAVSSCISVKVNVGVRGLQTFSHGRRSPSPAPAAATTNAHTTAAASPPQRDVLTVHDAAYYLLELTRVSVEFAPLGAPEGTGTAPDDNAAVLCLFPLDNEDCFSILRRPAIVASVAKNLAWLTSEEERDPFAFLALHSYGSVRRRGLSIVSCNRPEMGGLHASFAVCDYRGAPLGSCVIALSDGEGQPIREAKQGAFPLTVGGCRCGTLRCDVRITQLWLEGSSVHH